MKKATALILALVLCLTAAFALAESKFVSDGIYDGFNSIASESLAGYNPKFSYDETANLYLITMNLDGIAESIKGIVNESPDTWNTVKDNMASMSNVIYSGLKDLDYDVNCMILLTDNIGSYPVVLLTAVNGVVVFDIAK